MPIKNAASVPSGKVVIVGAGPTGLMLAGELALLSVDTVVVERRPTGTSGESRAPGVQSRTMEIFGQRGFADQFLAKGREQSAVVFSGIPMFPGRADPRWPKGLIIPQHETEKILAARVRELGAEVRWSTELVGLREHEGGVDVLVRGESGQATIRADHVVGCDGGHSAVRKLSGIPFLGEDPVSHWVVADARLEDPPADISAFGRNGRVGVYQISRAEPGWFRITLMRAGPPPSDRAAPVTLDELREAMRYAFGSDYGLCSARWTSRFTDGFRLATHFRQGRIFLAGDAAHTHAAFGGQGLNLGIQDAANLGWKLAAVACGAPDAVLDSYHDERRPVAQAMMRWTNAQTLLAKPGTQADAMRDVLAELMTCTGVAEHMSGVLSGLDLRYPIGDGHPLVGLRAPDLALRGERGDIRLFDLLRHCRPLLIGLGAPAMAPLSAPWAQKADYIEASLDRSGASGDTWDVPVFGRLPAADALFIRPDGYVAWANPLGRPVCGESLTAALARWLG